MNNMINMEIGAEVSIVPSYDSPGEEDFSESEQAPKRKSKRDINWKLEKEYPDMKTAKQFLVDEGMWSYSFTNRLTNGDVNLYYRCNKVKYRGPQCNSGIYLHCPADHGIVVIYRAEQRHNCHEISSEARPKLTEQLKNEIKKLFDSDPRIKPKSVLKLIGNRGMEVPKKSLVNNYLAFLRKKKFGSSTLSLGELETFLRNHSNIPDNETEAFVAAYVVKDDDPNYFRFFVTSKQLLQLAKNVKHIHADATYKLIWQGFPVLVVGTTDRSKHFHCFGIAVCSNEKTEDFEFLFKAIADGVNNVFYENISPHILISDAAESIHEGFKHVFGNESIIVMCWAHMKKNVQKKAEELITPKEKVKEMLQDLDKLQLSQTQDIFKKASELFLEKWADQRKFVSYFKTQWLDKNRNWFEGIGIRIPSTNNALEAWNKVMKDENTLRERLPLSHFLQMVFNYVSSWSTEYTSNMKIFKTEPDIDLKLWTSAYQWAKSNNDVTSQPNDVDSVKYCIIKKLVTAEFKTFEEFKDVCFSSWTTVLPISKDQWINGNCDCPAYFKHMIRKHIVGLAIRLKHVVPPPEAKNIPIGQKRKRGRPSKAKKALLVQ